MPLGLTDTQGNVGVKFYNTRGQFSRWTFLMDSIVQTALGRVVMLYTYR